MIAFHTVLNRVLMLSISVDRKFLIPFHKVSASVLMLFHTLDRCSFALSQSPLMTATTVDTISAIVLKATPRTSPSRDARLSITGDRKSTMVFTKKVMTSIKGGRIVFSRFTNGSSRTIRRLISGCNSDSIGSSSGSSAEINSTMIGRIADTI